MLKKYEVVGANIYRSTGMLEVHIENGMKTYSQVDLINDLEELSLNELLQINKFLDEYRKMDIDDVPLTIKKTLAKFNRALRMRIGTNK